MLRAPKKSSVIQIMTFSPRAPQFLIDTFLIVKPGTLVLRDRLFTRLVQEIPVPRILIVPDSIQLIHKIYLYFLVQGGFVKMSRKWIKIDLFRPNMT